MQLVSHFKHVQKDSNELFKNGQVIKHYNKLTQISELQKGITAKNAVVRVVMSLLTQLHTVSRKVNVLRNNFNENFQKGHKCKNTVGRVMPHVAFSDL